MPPLHPNCRSTIAGSLRGEDTQKTGTRAARNGQGKTIFVLASMTYDDWKDIYVDKSAPLMDWVKKYMPFLSVQTTKGLVSDIIKENQWKSFAEKLGDANIDDVKETLANASSDMQHVWNKYMDSFNVLDYSLPSSKVAHYSPADNGIRLNWKHVSQDEWINLGIPGRDTEIVKKANGTLFRELGHHVSGLWCRANGFTYSDISLK